MLPHSPFTDALSSQLEQASLPSYTLIEEKSHQMQDFTQVDNKFSFHPSENKLFPKGSAKLQRTHSFPMQPKQFERASPMRTSSVTDLGTQGNLLSSEFTPFSDNLVSYSRSIKEESSSLPNSIALYSGVECLHNQQQIVGNDNIRNSSSQLSQHVNNFSSNTIVANEVFPPTPIITGNRLQGIPSVHQPNQPESSSTRQSGGLQAKVNTNSSMVEMVQRTTDGRRDTLDSWNDKLPAFLDATESGGSEDHDLSWEDIYWGLE